MKVAIVHDFAYKMGGAERLVDTLLALYPEADLFMMFGDVSNLSDNFRNRTVYYSYLNKIPFLRHFYRYTFMLWPSAIESFNFSEYDLVISHSTVAAKGVLTDINTKHMSFLSSFMRYAWDLRHTYFYDGNRGLFGRMKRVIISFFLSYLRAWDLSVNSRIDKMLVCSNFVKERVKKYYKKNDVTVAHPPVDLSKCFAKEIRGEYYLAVSPFEPNKNGHLLIESAIKYRYPLKIVGVGSMKKQLERKARRAGADNIQFLGWVSEEDKHELLAGAKAFLFCGVEDFGISAVEAIASGAPVVAYKAGGALDFVHEGRSGLFFEEDDVEALWEAIVKAEKIEWDRMWMRQFAQEKFGKGRFEKEIVRQAEQLMQVNPLLKKVKK